MEKLRVWSRVCGSIMLWVFMTASGTTALQTHVRNKDGLCTHSWTSLKISFNFNTAECFNFHEQIGLN